MSDQLIRQLREQRESWVALPHLGARIRVRRPAEMEMVQIQTATPLELVCRHCVGWDGITQAQLLGESVGSGDAVAWSAELWAEVAADRAEWVSLLSQEIVRLVADYLQRKQAALGN